MIGTINSTAVVTTSMATGPSEKNPDPSGSFESFSQPDSGGMGHKPGAKIDWDDKGNLHSFLANYKEVIF